MTQLDPYSNIGRGWDQPMAHGEAADFSTADHEFSAVTRAILLVQDGNSAGTAVLTLAGGEDVSVATSTSPQWLPLRCTHAKMTSTNATVIGFW